MDKIIYAWAIGAIIGHAIANHLSRRVLKNAIAGRVLFIGRRAFYIRPIGLFDNSKKSVRSLSMVIDSIDKRLGDEVPRM